MQLSWQASQKKALASAPGGRRTGLAAGEEAAEASDGAELPLTLPPEELRGSQWVMTGHRLD